MSRGGLQVPAHAIARRRAHRMKYTELYKAVHAGQDSYLEPARRWYQQGRRRKADGSVLQALQLMEERLSLEEIAHFRAAVAHQHSRTLASSQAVMQHVLDAVDAIVGNLGSLQPALEAMLLQKDVTQQADILAIRVAVSCPKLGAIAHVGDAWKAALPQPLPNAFSYLAAALHNTQFHLHPSGRCPCIMLTETNNA